MQSLFNYIDVNEPFDVVSRGKKIITTTRDRLRKPQLPKQIKKPKVVISKPVHNTKPAGELPPPVSLPENVERRNWKRWWRNNRYYYGDRDYYLYAGYPLWWVDYYYPLYDYDYDYVYDYPIYPTRFVYGDRGAVSVVPPSTYRDAPQQPSETPKAACTTCGSAPSSVGISMPSDNMLLKLLVVGLLAVLVILFILFIIAK